MLFYVKFPYFNISGNTLIYCVSNSVSPIANNLINTNINFKTNITMTLDDINGLMYFCINTFGNMNAPFIIVVNRAQQEADECFIDLHTFLYIQNQIREAEKEYYNYLEQQEQQEQDYVDDCWQWDEKYRE